MLHAIQRTGSTQGGADRPFVNDPQTPAKLEQRARMAQCARAWKAMSLAQAQAWRDFAAARGGKPQLLFQALGCKVLQVNPSAALPLLPPETEFPGDAVRFSVSSGTGGVVVTADRANAPGVVTEVLLQMLPSVHCRTYLSRYRSAGFHACSAGEARTYSASPGVYALATRFIYTPTGQSTALIKWGLVAE